MEIDVEEIGNLIKMVDVNLIRNYVIVSYVIVVMKIGN